MTQAILDPRTIAHLPYDKRIRLINMQRAAIERAKAKAERERMLIKSKTTERVLYGIAFENHRTGKAGFIYMHANDRNDAINQILTSRTLRGSRIVAVAPAIGAWSADGKTAYIYS